MKKLLTLIIVFFVALPWSCKKYEEDDYWFTLRSVKNRVVGKKIIVSHTIGITDVNEYWKTRFGDFYLDFTNDEYNPNKSSAGYKLFVYQKETNQKLCDGEWWFEGDTRLQFYFDCLDADTTTSWPERIHGAGGKIYKLSHSEMRLTSSGTITELQNTPVLQDIYLSHYK